MAQGMVKWKQTVKPSQKVHSLHCTALQRLERWLFPDLLSVSIFTWSVLYKKPKTQANAVNRSLSAWPPSQNTNYTGWEEVLVVSSETF